MSNKGSGVRFRLAATGPSLLEQWRTKNLIHNDGHHFDVGRKKDKFAAQKLALEKESKALADRLAEARVVEEGIR